MAGIGFSINEILKEKNLTSRPRAYTYAAVTAAGPLILGEIVLFSVYLLASFSKINLADRNLLVALITYALLASLLVNGFSSLVISRYLSDKLYTKKLKGFLATYWGSQFFLVSCGGFLYVIFLIFSGVGFIYGILAWILFCELIMTWNAINFLTVTKDYMGIFKAFMWTILVTFLIGAFFLILKFPVVIALLWAIVLGYASFIVQVSLVLYRQFPQKIVAKELFHFLTYFDKYKKLAVIGGCTQIGLLSHVVAVWFSPIGQQVKGIFHIAPYYDLSVFIASLTMLTTTINFIVVLEVDFSKVSYNFYQLFNRGGSLQELRDAENEMLASLRRHLKSVGWKQLLTTLIAISFGLAILSYLPLGFNDTMRGYFRVLCVAYAIYALANVVTLTTTYFGNVDKAYRTSILFALTVTLFSFGLIFANSLFYGFGFLLGSVIYFLLSWYDLENITSNLFYQVLSRQPLIQKKEEGGFFHYLYKWLTVKTIAIFKKGITYEKE